MAMAIKNYRWVVCSLLFFATTIIYMDRQILAIIKPILDKQLHWSNEQYGLVTASFQAAYALGALGFGWLIDRYGTKAGYSITIGAWAAAAMGHALVSSVMGFGIARFCLGLGEAGNFPAAIKTVVLWFPKRERAFSTSLFNSGSNVGAVLAPATVPYLALNWGWQSAFLVVGVAGLFWLLAWNLFYDVPERVKGITPEELAHIRSDAEAVSTVRIPWSTLLTYRQTWAYVIARMLTDPIWWFFLFWLPNYFNQSRGLDIKHSGKLLVSVYSIVTILSILGGWVTGHLTTLGWSVTRARKTGLFCFALMVVPIYFATQVGDWTAVLLIGIAAGAHQAWSANLFTSVSDLFPAKAVASVTGLGTTAGSLMGIIFPIVTGTLIDHFQRTHEVTVAYRILFAICAFAYLVAFAFNHLLAPRFERVVLRS